MKERARSERESERKRKKERKGEGEREAYDEITPFSGFSKRERVIHTHTQAVHSKQETSYERIKPIEKSSIFSSYPSVERGARRGDGSEEESEAWTEV